MRTIIFLGIFLLASATVAWSPASSTNLEPTFKTKDIQGTFVVLSLKSGALNVTNVVRARKRFFPASTFKIANSLIALETRAVGDENEIIPYGGKPQPFKSWERDMSMRDAISVSNVPIYQEIARRVGKGTYLEWLRKLEYGNRQIANDIERFWLDGPLEISAIEQVQFLTKLVSGKLPVSERARRIVTDILKLEQRNGKTLYGKTGWTIAPDPDIGWFVGWVDDGQDKHVFALNMDVHSRADARLRKKLALQLLSQLGIY